MRVLPLLLLLLAPASPCRSQLTEVPGVPGVPFLSVAARGDTLFAGAENVLYVSPDRGETWGPTAPVSTDTLYIDAIAATDAGWFVGASPFGVLRSRDRGQTWAPLNAGLDGFGARYVSDFEVWGDHLYAATESGVFALDLQQPTAWQRFGDEFAENEAQTVPELALDGSRLIAVAGGNGLVFVRDLAAPGSGWEPTPLTGHLVTVARTGVGLVAATRRQAFSSLDGGETWAQTAPLPVTGFSAVAASGAADAAYLAVTNTPGVSHLLRSDDLTGAWAYVAAIPETLGMLAFEGGLLLAQADGLRIWRTDGGTGAEPRPRDERAIPVTVAPHPVRAEATVRFHVREAGRARAEVFDVLGRRVAVLADSVLPAGPQAVALDGRALPAGAYIVRVTAAGGAGSQRLTVVR